MLLYYLNSVKVIQEIVIACYISYVIILPQCRNGFCLPHNFANGITLCLLCGHQSFIHCFRGEGVGFLSISLSNFGSSIIYTLLSLPFLKSTTTKTKVSRTDEKPSVNLDLLKGILSTLVEIWL